MAMELEGSAELAAALDPENEDWTVSALQKVADDPESPWRPARIGTLLEQTTSNRVRNAAAIALVDLRAAGSAPIIASLVIHPEVAACSGTLLYALDRLGATLPLDAFLSVIEHGSFEARDEAMALLHADRIDLADVDDPQSILERLAACARTGSPEATESLDVLEPVLSGRSAPGMRP